MVGVLVVVVRVGEVLAGVCSQLRADAAASESRNVPSAPPANRKIIAALSSTAKPRVADDDSACTSSMSPTSWSSRFTSCVRLI